MISRTLLLLCMSLGPVAAMSQVQPQAESDPPWVKGIATPRIVYSVPGMDRAVVHKDIVYKRAGERELKMDVYQPAGLRANEKRHAVLFIHGGYLPPNLLTKPKDWGVYVSWGQLMAASGLVGVTFNHRLYSSWNSLPDSETDVLDAIRYVREHAESFNIDKDHLTLCVYSGGGLLMSTALREPLPFVSSVVGYYAMLDLQAVREQAPDAVSEAIARDFSPLRLIAAKDKRFPAIFLSRGGRDDAGLNRALDAFIQAALANDVMLDVMTHPAGVHGFDVKNDDERSREIIRQTVEFIRAH